MFLDVKTFSTTAAKLNPLSPLIKSLSVFNYFWTIDLLSFLMVTVHCITPGQENSWREQSSAQGESRQSPLWPGQQAAQNVPWGKGVHYPTCHMWLSRQLNFEGRAGRSSELHFLTRGACTAENDVGLVLALLLCALPPILISRGASWRGSRTAVQLAAWRLFISSASPLSSCLLACVRHK